MNRSYCSSRGCKIPKIKALAGSSICWVLYSIGDSTDVILHKEKCGWTDVRNKKGNRLYYFPPFEARLPPQRSNFPLFYCGFSHSEFGAANLDHSTAPAYMWLWKWKPQERKNQIVVWFGWSPQWWHMAPFVQEKWVLFSLITFCCLGMAFSGKICLVNLEK